METDAESTDLPLYRVSENIHQVAYSSSSLPNQFEFDFSSQIDQRQCAALPYAPLQGDLYSQDKRPI